MSKPLRTSDSTDVALPVGPRRQCTARLGRWRRLGQLDHLKHAMAELLMRKFAVNSPALALIEVTATVFDLTTRIRNRRYSRLRISRPACALNPAPIPIRRAS